MLAVILIGALTILAFYLASKADKFYRNPRPPKQKRKGKK